MIIEFPYLIGIALVEKDDKRSMPIGGKSIPKAIEPSEEPGVKGNLIALELLIRVLQGGDDLRVKRCFGEKSFLLIQMSMATMQNQLPVIKAEWLKTGDSEKLLQSLNKFCQGIWKIDFAKHSGVYYEQITA